MLPGKCFKQPRSVPKGFTLVETLIALAVFIIAVVYLAGVFPTGLGFTLSAQHKTVAVALAQARIEEIISSQYSGVTVGQAREASLSAIDPDFSHYSRTTTVNYVNGDLQTVGADIGLKKIQVAVFWKDRADQATTSINLMTLIANY
ncbi:MAG: prepilin-type N-terminal cleavage/methylation domain-containing protein [Candidatus Komeilibacteria bacterium]|nr:prepilin-type N-terminal cleavage/methylation domain-containing protein [Candidatus Komeilibacteria bacterium]